MSLFLLFVSLVICLASAAWAAVLVYRLRDVRLGGLAALLAMMTVWRMAVLAAAWRSPPGAPVELYTETQGRSAAVGIVAGLAGLAAAVLISRILTDQRRLAGQLARSEAAARSLAENVPDIVCRFDRHLRHVFINRQIEARTGIPAEQFLGKSNRELGMPAELVDYWETKLRAAFAEGCEATLEFEYPSPTGARFFEARLVPEIGADGTPETVLCVTRDITESKRTAMALQSSNRTLNSLIEASPLAVIVVDPQGRVTTWNPAAEALFGWSAAEVLGRPLPTVPDDQRASFADMIREEFAGKRRVGMEVARLRKGGAPVIAQCWTAPIYDADGRITATLGMLADASELRRVESALRDTESRLAHVARLSTMGEMVAGIAHEINQPLYAIANYANACTNTLTHEPERAVEKLPHWTRQIAEQAIRAGEIIRRLRTFAHKNPACRMAVSLDQVVRESLSLVAADLRNHMIDVDLQLEQPPAEVLVDRVQIQQVLVNLVKNACEVLADAPEGDRRVTVRTTNSDGTVDVAVEDNGPGLPADAGERIFEAFYTTKPEGLGMGLAISRTIVESHGGKLTAESRPAGGSIVKFSLPVSLSGAA
jgi:two-component system, LuxR family, sensor kinase FixL